MQPFWHGRLYTKGISAKSCRAALRSSNNFILKGENTLNYTEHYQLTQWDASDRVLHENFNSDNQKIDKALSQKTSVTFGTYAGNGAAYQSIHLGFTPKILYTCTKSGLAGSATGSGYSYGGLCTREHPVALESRTVVEIVDNGFKVFKPNDYIRSNLIGETYYYIAFA